MTHLAMIEGVVRALFFAQGRFNKKHYTYKNLKQGNNRISIISLFPGSCS